MILLGGLCVLISNKPYCACVSGYTGTNCGTATTTTTATTKTTTSACNNYACQNGIFYFYFILNKDKLSKLKKKTMFEVVFVFLLAEIHTVRVVLLTLERFVKIHNRRQQQQQKQLLHRLRRLFTKNLF